MKQITKTTGAVASLVISGANSLRVFAADVCNTTAPASVKEAAGCSGNSNELPNIVTNILNSIILVLGIIAVIFIIVGGVQYMTSGGDTGKVSKAKNTILYAVIGLVICALAFAIVNFVIGII